MNLDLASISIPLWILLVIFGLFLAFFLLYCLFNLYHLLRFGTADLGLFLITAVFVIGSASLVTGSFWLLADYDWTGSISLSSLYHPENTVQYFRY